MNEQNANRSIPFVDTHHHLWELDRLDYEWLTDATADDDGPIGPYKPLRTDWGPPRLFREFYGQNVIKSIHVEAAMTGPDPVAETEWLATVNAEYGRPNAFVVYCDLKTDDAGSQLDRHLAASPLVRGVRDYIPGEEGMAAFRAGLQQLQERGLSFDLNPPEAGFHVLIELVNDFPDLQFVVGHAGAPRASEPETFDAWAANITEIAAADNVTIKISGMGMRANAWTIDSIRRWVLHCIEAFGVERSMFGTNWPVDVLFASYFEQVDAYRIILAEGGFSDADQHALLHGNAERIYRI